MQAIQTPGIVASVIIPAHNEAASIAACIESLCLTRMSNTVEVIVAANGCTDETARIARSFEYVRVLEIAEPSKANALREADRIASAHSRIYLDGDITLGAGTLASILGAITTSVPVIVAPVPHYDCSEASSIVCDYYAIKERLPSTARGTVGRGVFGVSASGRRRFGQFEDFTADDLFAASFFGADEVVTCSGFSVVKVPKTLTSLLRVRSRIARGNRELRATIGSHQEETVSPDLKVELVEVLRREPHLLRAAAAFVLVSVLARLSARFSRDTWGRDASSRT